MTKKTFKEASKLESDNFEMLVKKLSTIDGINLEQAEHMAMYGVADDVYTVQTFYRISGQAAESAIKVFKEK